MILCNSNGVVNYAGIDNFHLNPRAWPADENSESEEASEAEKLSSEDDTEQRQKRIT